MLAAHHRRGAAGRRGVRGGAGGKVRELGKPRHPALDADLGRRPGARGLVQAAGGDADPLAGKVAKRQRRPALLALDPFGGSGSTLIACEKTGRQARLIELDPKYVDTIILRWQEFSGGVATLDGDGRSYEEIAAAREVAVGHQPVSLR